MENPDSIPASALVYFRFDIVAVRNDPNDLYLLLAIIPPGLTVLIYAVGVTFAYMGWNYPIMLPKISNFCLSMIG
jgi:hypothetical protein